MTEIEKLKFVLEEIAYGAPWGGPARDHVRYMRKIADDVLENGSTKSIPGAPDRE